MLSRGRRGVAAVLVSAAATAAAVAAVAAPDASHAAQPAASNECVSMCDVHRSVFAADFAELAAAGMIGSQNLLAGVHEPIPAAELATWIASLLVSFPDRSGYAVDALTELPPTALITRAQAAILFASVFADTAALPDRTSAEELYNDINPAIDPTAAAAAATLAYIGITMDCDSTPGGHCGGQWLTRGQTARTLARYAQLTGYPPRDAYQPPTPTQAAPFAGCADGHHAHLSGNGDSAGVCHSDDGHTPALCDAAAPKYWLIHDSDREHPRLGTRLTAAPCPPPVPSSNKFNENVAPLAGDVVVVGVSLPPAADTGQRRVHVWTEPHRCDECAEAAAGVDYAAISPQQPVEITFGPEGGYAAVKIPTAASDGTWPKSFTVVMANAEPLHAHAKARVVAVMQAPP